VPGHRATISNARCAHVIGRVSLAVVKYSRAQEPAFSHTERNFNRRAARRDSVSLRPHSGLAVAAGRPLEEFRSRRRRICLTRVAPRIERILKQDFVASVRARAG